MASDVLVALTKDPLVLRQLKKAAEDLKVGLDLVGTSAELIALDTQPLAVVLDLEVDGAIELALALKERWPFLLLVGYLTLPEPDRWRSAQDAGFDLVTTRGGIGRQLAAKAREWKASPGCSSMRGAGIR